MLTSPALITVYLPLTAPTSGSAKLETSFRIESGLSWAGASENTTISPRNRGTAELSALIFPRFGRQSNTRMWGASASPPASGAFQQAINLRFTEEINWAAKNIVKAHFSHRHAPGPVSRPRG